ncbi:hypothetical protein [Listeria cornellensis]|uniref:Uncharacterized protein n=1 Tax=Listeria cornellensis FSL F6-0969 TaxID=1265820 RepID=W7C2W7_9LIST|nr:hypothetical protein [Listeria cornellensis]EUJ31585.1 hypothetical protein PCORN_04572 [Listeria cornellensis FSL F6-0969]
MDYSNMLADINKALDSAIKLGSKHAIDSLQSEKKYIERQAQLTLLRAELEQKTNEISTKTKEILSGNTRLFEEWFHELTNIENQLKISFESKTGQAIGTSLMNKRNTLCQYYGQDYRELQNGFKVRPIS